MTTLYEEDFYLWTQQTAAHADHLHEIYPTAEPRE